jgi:hypothetical protein
MNYTTTTIDNLSILTFDDTATNHADAREGSALAMVKYANDNSIGGADDWVLPSRETLLDVYQLLDVEDDKWYWSSSPYVGNLVPHLAWGVFFGNGFVLRLSRISNYYVRLVRTSQFLG